MMPGVGRTSMVQIQFIDNAHTVQFNGIVWQGGPGQTTWRVIHTGNIEVRVNEEIVLEVSGESERIADDIAVNWEGDWLHLAVTYDYGADLYEAPDKQVEMGIYQRAPWGGWTLLPTHRLYPEPPDPELAQREIGLYTIISFAYLGIGLGLGSLLVVWLWGKRALWNSRETWIIVAIILAAFLVRYILMLDRAASDASLFIPFAGADNYVFMARNTLAGQSYLAGAYYAPGNILWLLGLMVVVGPQLWKLYLINTILGALSVGAIIAASRLVFGRAAGYIAGVFAALFPLLIFYHTTLQPASLVASLTPVVILAGLYVLRQPSLKTIALFGLLLGMVTLVRSTTAFIGVAFFLALVVTKRESMTWRTIVRRTAAVACIAIVTILPQTIANWSSGQLAPIHSSAPPTFYWGINRDGDGGRVQGQAFEVAEFRGEQWMDEALDDIQNHPMRTFELLLHKLGVLWSNTDHGNNVSFRLQGLDHSQLLRFVSLNGVWGTTVLALLAFVGLGIMLLSSPDRKDAGNFLLWSLLFISLATISFNVFGRMRAQTWPMLFIPASGAVVQLAQRRVDWRVLLSISVAVGLISLFWAFEYHLPRKHFYHGELPDTVVSYDHSINNEIRFLGFEPVETDHQSYLYLTVYWEAISPPSRDYTVYVVLLDSDSNVLAYHPDYLIGEVSYPKVGTERWSVGDVLRESYLIRFTDNPSQAQVGELTIGIYDLMHERLANVGLLNGDPMPTITGDLLPVDYRVGNTLRITGTSVPRTIRSDAGELIVGVQWEAVQPMIEDYMIFYHLFDSEMNLVAQSDGPSLIGDWTTSALIPDYPVGGRRVLDLPDELTAGDYLLRMGVYNHGADERLSIVDQDRTYLPDGLIDLATIRVEH